MFAAAATSPAAMPRWSVDGALRGTSAVRGVGVGANQGSVTIERNRELQERGSGFEVHAAAETSSAHLMVGARNIDDTQRDVREWYWSDNPESPDHSCDRNQRCIH